MTNKITQSDQVSGILHRLQEKDPLNFVIENIRIPHVQDSALKARIISKLDVNTRNELAGGMKEMVCRLMKMKPVLEAIAANKIIKWGFNEKGLVFFIDNEEYTLFKISDFTRYENTPILSKSFFEYFFIPSIPKYAKFYQAWQRTKRHIAILTSQNSSSETVEKATTIYTETLAKLTQEAENFKKSDNFLYRNFSDFNDIANLCSTSANILSTSSSVLASLLSSLSFVAKGILFFLNHGTNLYIESSRPENFKKLTSGEKGFSTFGASYGLFIIVGAVFAILALTCPAAIGLSSMYSTYLFGGLICGTFCAIGFADSIYRYFHANNFREELKLILQNKDLSPPEKLQLYTNKIKEKIFLQEEEITRIKKDFIAANKQALSEKGFASGDNPEDFLQEEIHDKLLQESRYKIENFIQMTSKEIFEFCKQTPDLSNIDENLIKKLLYQIDKASHANKTTQAGYFWITVIGTIGTILGFVLTGGAAPLIMAGIWSLVAILFLYWDFSSTRGFLTDLYYYLTREDESLEGLNIPVHNNFTSAFNDAAFNIAHNVAKKFFLQVPSRNEQPSR